MKASCQHDCCLRYVAPLLSDFNWADEQLGADLLAIDEMVGRRIARSRSIRVIGTLGILEEAGRLGWIDLPFVLTQLQQTTFRVSEPLIQQILERYRSQS